MTQKKRNHNEWFYITDSRYIHGTRKRDPALIEEILQRPGNTLTREFLETPYECVVDHVPSRKTCPTCKAKLLPGEYIWGWYEYHNARKRLIQKFCRSCFPSIRESLNSHTDTCGCQVTLCGDSLPDWLTLENDDANCQLVNS